MLLMSQKTIESPKMARDKLIFLFQQLGFVVNVNKSVLSPTQSLEFLTLEIDSVKTTLTLPEAKGKKLISKCKNLIATPKVTLFEVTSLIGTLCSTAQTVLPVLLQMIFLQQQQIQALKANPSYQSTLYLNQDSLQELQWWVNNLEIWNGKSVLTPASKTIIQKRCLQEGLGRLFPESINGLSVESTRVQFTHKCIGVEGNQASSVDIFKIVSASICTYSGGQYSSSFLSTKMGGTNNKEMIVIAKEIWNFSTFKEITIPTKYFREDSMREQICLFASRVCHQIPAYMVWRPESQSQATDAFQQSWSRTGLLYAFPPFHWYGKFF